MHSMCRACAKAQQKTHTHSTPPKKINNVLNVDDLKKKESSKNLLFDLSSSFQVPDNVAFTLVLPLCSDGVWLLGLGRTLWLLPCADTAAKSLQSCLTLCDPIDGSPPGSPVPGILQARTLEWVAISFSNA